MPRPHTEGNRLPAFFSDKNGCWIWTRSVSWNGYPQKDVNGKTVRVHREHWETFNGPIPDGLEMDHLCKVPRCVNPAHLEPVTKHTNTVLRGSGPAAINYRKTHCKSGHPFDEKNTGRQILKGVDRGRSCRKCHAEVERRRRRNANLRG